MLLLKGEVFSDSTSKQSLCISKTMHLLVDNEHEEPTINKYSHED